MKKKYLHSIGDCTTASPIQTQDDRWNTIHGQQLNGQPKTKGVFIHNGRKIVVR